MKARVILIPAISSASKLIGVNIVKRKKGITNPRVKNLIPSPRTSFKSCLNKNR